MDHILKTLEARTARRPHKRHKIRKTLKIRPLDRPLLIVAALFAASSFFFAQNIPSPTQTDPPATPSASPASQTAPQTAPPSPQAKPQVKTIGLPTQYVKANFLSEIDDTITASGDVEIRYNDTYLYADEVVYNKVTQDVRAVGHVSLIRPGEAFTADRLTFNMETGLGEGTNVVGLVQPSYRYESDSVLRETPDLFRLGKSKITACAQPVPRWEFSASRANFMRDDYIEMWNPVLRVKNIPIFYLPYMKYPLDQERATGFLMPQIGYSQRKGMTYTQQFYWAIARNMDASFSFDYYGAAGVGSGLEYRYLFADGTWGNLHAYSFFYKTPEPTEENPEPEKSDNALLFRWQHNQKLPGNISFVASIDYQNSFSFMREFDNNYARALIYNRSSQVYATKSWRGATLSMRFSRFETSFASWDQSIVRQSLPQINFATFQRKLWGPIYYSLTAAYNNWQYGISSQFENDTETRSSELYFGPTFTLPINTIPWFTMDLTASAHFSYYGNSLDPDTRQVLDKGLLSGNYVLSASFTGPIFFRVFNLTDRDVKIKHVIEPNITYQFDSPTMNSDRIVTMYGFFFRYHYVTYGLTNHVLVKKGKNRAAEVFTWGISQAYYLDPENSYMALFPLPDGTIQRFSEISTYVRFYPGTKLSIDLGAGYHTYKSILSNLRASVNYGSPADDLYFSLSWYRSQNPYYTDILFNREQIGVSGGVKLPRLNIEALGEVEYNISAKELLYAGLAAVWHYQCVDFKADVRAFFFREKPEVQVRFSIGLGNISPTTDFLGGRQVTGAGRRGQ